MRLCLQQKVSVDPMFWIFLMYLDMFVSSHNEDKYSYWISKIENVNVDNGKICEFYCEIIIIILDLWLNDFKYVLTKFVDGLQSMAYM